MLRGGGAQSLILRGQWVVENEIKNESLMQGVGGLSPGPGPSAGCFLGSEPRLQLGACPEQSPGSPKGRPAQLSKSDFADLGQLKPCWQKGRAS